MKANPQDFFFEQHPVGACFEKSALGGFFPKPSFPLSTGIAGNHWLDVGSIKSVLIQPKYLGKKPKMGAWECRERWREGRSWRNRGIEALLHFSQLYFYPNFLIFPKFCSFQVHQYWGISCSSAPHGMGEQFNLQHDKMIIPNIFSTQKKKRKKNPIIQSWFWHLPARTKLGFTYRIIETFPCVII